ncbi:MAG: UxaA family hydrolase [Ruminococcaceae bacterium]|nr:UxaA family hydrolase [Oscillospiraceae bacterium]
MKFKGYKRSDNTFGSRNLVAVIPSVMCANDVVDTIVDNVPNTRGFFHHQGCCQLEPDLKTVSETLISLGKSPNAGAVLIVSLGCEGTDTERLYNELTATGKPVEIICIQELGGYSNAVAEGINKAQKLAQAIGGMTREDADLSNIVMSIKCGGSDATSGMASNLVIGYVADKIVDLGGTVVFGEVTEFIGAEHILAKRAVSEEVGKNIIKLVKDLEERANAVGVDMRKGQPTPGNIKGGLSSIEEKSLGAIVKSGHRPIQGILEYHEPIGKRKGLWIKDTPGREPEILTGMAATGSQVMLFSTGRGAPQGFPTMPVIKICGNPITYRNMSNDMDINAGLILSGEKSVEEVGEEAFEFMLKVLSGMPTKNEAIGYYRHIDIWVKGPVI